MYIDPGELNKRIEIYKRVVPAPDADGYATPSLVCVCRPWAKVSNFTAKEVAMHDADYLSSTVRFLIRSRPGLTGIPITRLTTLPHWGITVNILRFMPSSAHWRLPHDAE